MKNLSCCFLLFFFFVCCVPCEAEPLEWDTVRQKMAAESGYSLKCEYTGPEGLYFFSYVVHGAGERILTEILRGSSRGAGTRVYFDKEKDNENVTMKTRLFKLRRSLQSRDIKGTPLYSPLFLHVLGEICEPQPREILTDVQGNTIFLFGDRTNLHEFLEVDPEGNPLRLKRMKQDEELTSLVFSDLTWGDGPMNWKE